jgi:hypothetical protein
MDKSVQSMRTRGGFATVKMVAVMPDPQAKVEEPEMPHEPFEDLRVNPEPILRAHQHDLVVELDEESFLT